MATPTVDEQATALGLTEEDENLASQLPQPGEILTIPEPRAQVPAEFYERVSEGDPTTPMETSRGEVPSFGRDVLGTFSEPVDLPRATGLDFTIQLDPRKRENAEGIYTQYFTPYDPENTEAQKEIDNALLGGVRIITSIYDSEDPYAQAYGGRRTFQFPTPLVTGVKNDGTPYTREELLHERARFIRLVGGTSVVVPNRYDENNNPVGGREVSLPVLRELKQIRELAPSDGRMTYLSSEGIADFFGVSPEFVQDITGKFTIRGPVVPFYSNLVSGDNERVGKFAKFLDQQGYLDPYMKRDLLFAQGTGALDSYRNEGRGLDPFRAMINLGVALYDYTTSEESTEDGSVVEGEDGKTRVRWEYLPLVASKLAEKTGLEVEMVEKMLIFSPDTLTLVQNVLPEAIAGMGLGAGVRIGLAEVGTYSMMRWVKSKKIYGNAKNLDEAAKNSGNSVGKIFADYHADRLSYRWGFFQNSMRGKNVEDLELSTMLRGMGDPKFKKQVFEERWAQATTRLDAAKENLAKHRARLDAGKKVDEQVIIDAEKRVKNAENALYDLRSQMAVPQYFRDISRETGLSVAGAAILGQTAQDFGVTNPTALSFIEMGGAITAVMAPKVGTAPILLPGYIVMSLFNLVATPTTGARLGKGQARKEAEKWSAFLNDLNPEQYAQLEVHANKVLALQDQMRATGLFTEADLEMTAAEIINLPLLRLYQQQIGDMVSVADLERMDQSLFEISQSMGQEKISLNNMARSIERLLPLESEDIKEQFPGLAEFYVDIKKLHAGLERDFEIRHGALKAEMESRHATTMLYLSGKAVQKDEKGNVVIADYKSYFDEYEATLIKTLDMQGKNADEIIETLREVQQERLDTLIQFAKEARANPLDKEFDESVHMAALIDTKRRLTEQAVDKRYRDWEKMAPEDTFMDAQIILKELQNSGGTDLADPRLQGIGFETTDWEDVAPGIKYMYAGNSIGSTSSSRMSEMFGEGARRHLDKIREQFVERENEELFDKLLGAAGADTESDPFLQWRAVKGFLEQAPEEELAVLSGKIPVATFRKIGEDLALPITPVEMRLIASALGDREFAALASRRPAGALDPGRIKNNIFALAESEEFGFKANFYIRGGTAVGPELISELRVTNQYYVDEWIDRYIKDPTLKGLVYPQGGIKLQENKMLISYAPGKGPANQLSIMLKGLGQLEEGATQAQVLDVIKPLIQGTGGRKVTDAAGNEMFVLDLNSNETLALREILSIRARRIIQRSKGAESLIENIDPDITPTELEEYLKKAAFDPQILGMTPEDEKILDALLSLKAYKFDENGVPIDAEFLVDADSVVELISFNSIRRVSKQVDQLATKYEKEFTGLIDQFNANAKEAFTSENAYRRAALVFTERAQGQADVEISQQIFTLSTTKNGQGVIEEMRNAHVNAIIRDFTRKYGRAPIPEEKQTLVENATKGFEQYRKDQVGRYIIDQATELAKPQVVTGAKSVRGESVNLAKLDEVLGDPDSSNPLMRERAEALKEVLGEEHYTDVKAIADFIALKTDTYDNVRFKGVARPYSVESYISRLYSISRDVVSPRYVLTEVALQAGRVANQQEFHKMLADPEVAELLAEIIRTGEILDERGAKRLFEAIASYTARTYSDIAEDEKSLNRQMSDIQPALRPEGATQQGLTQ